MASIAPQGPTVLDLSGIVDGQPIDAVDVTLPFEEAEPEIDDARTTSAVSSVDTEVKYLEEALIAGSNITITKQNPGGAETLLIDATGVGGNFAEYTLDEVADYTTTSTSFVDIDATNLALEITTTGGDVLVHFHGAFTTTQSSARVSLEIDVDGSPVGGEGGILKGRSSLNTPGATTLTFTRLITGLSAGSHTFKLQWSVGGGTATCLAGAGIDGIHPQFWVREAN